ncbi:NifB/NifX family molybdenum-iron cluster-binding protein [Ignavibacterium sp.]|uniref:NifB/NifX family molybdenum-iron cluster-binding protein n=1 Tax=Ignavibacterium sp. TaxID=2651167 RepID=UPI00307F68A6
MNNNFKIAFATNDGINTFAHFGRAKYFEVIEIENGNIKSRERREKPDFHSNAEHNHQHDHQGHHGRHSTILGLVKDCDFVVAGGMGYGIYDFLVSEGKTPIVTTVKNIDEALSLLVENKLENHIEKLH